MKTVLKRALCGITAFVVAAGAMSYFPADTFPGIARGVTAYAENETWRSTITADDSTISGDGSQDSPYEITTAEQLFAVMKKSETKYAILKNDIFINNGLLNRIDNESGEPSDTSDSIVCWTPISDDVFCKTSNEVINFAEQYHNHLGSAKCPICGTVNPQEPAKDSNGVYQIGTPSELLWFADHVNTVSGNQKAVLTADINMKDVKWTPIGTKDKTVLSIVPLLEPQIPPDFPSEDTLPEKKQSVIVPEF